MSLDHDHKSESEPTEPSNSSGDVNDEVSQAFSIVGIGASAGGLVAFEQFFTNLPPDTGMAFVVVQHLSPPHKSILPEILQRYTSMPVAQVTDGILVRPNGVYVIPPGTDLALKNGHLSLVKPEKARGYRLPIDFFFRSLAQDQGERAVGVVLSGTGSDGSLGLKTIKSEGGLTIAQEPETAEYGDMPRNAIATKEVDFILPPGKIGGLILKYIHHQVLTDYKINESEFQIPPSGLQKLYYLLRAKSGHDFSLYKQNTLLRRIERRMKICLVKSIDEYIARLEEQPEEIAALFQEMLINVTHFFRDPDAFQVLAEKVIQPLIATHCATQVPIRVWVAACSSGEEAYSIAIAIQEQFEALNASCKVQIYATDLDAEAIAAARKGFYADASLENVSAQRLQRFFQQEDEGYQIKKVIRDMVVFSTQNVISDPPFSKIDLLCCRNLLIYLEHELQNQLFLQFHYSLNPAGVLFLGNSESISGNSNLFSVLDRKAKLFQRKELLTQPATRPRARFIMQRGMPNALELSAGRSSEGGLREWAERALLEFHTPACVIIDKKHTIVFIHGRTGKFLEPSAGETSNNLIRMAREGLKTELASAIHAVLAHQAPVYREGVRVKTNGDYQAINLTVRLLPGSAGLGELLMVVFEEANPPHALEAPAAHSALPDVAPDPTLRFGSNRKVLQLEQELKEKDEYLRTIIDELEDANQDLKSINEELQSTNEEMQSSNEELETSKEELQSINEELSTINAELQNKNEELAGANNDIYNLLSSVEIGMLFLDLELQIRRFTPAVNRIYNFLPGDIGRPITHFVSNLQDDELVEAIRQVLHNLVPRAIELQTRAGIWYLVNIRPYRTLDNVINGAVVTFVDISEQKRGDELRRLGTILRDSNDAVTVQDFNGSILAWNRGATEMFGWNESEALGMNGLAMIPENARPEAIKLFQRLGQGERIRSFETQRVTRDGRILDIWMTLTALVDDARRVVAVASTERDITDRNQSRRAGYFENQALKALNHWYRFLLDQAGAAPQALAEAACRLLVDEGGCRLAWLGLLQPGKAGLLTPVAWAGLENAEAQNLAAAAEDALARALSSVKAALPGKPPANQPLEVLAQRAGALLALPLLVENEPRGVLVLDAAQPEALLEPALACLVEFSTRLAQVFAGQSPDDERQET